MRRTFLHLLWGLLLLLVTVPQVSAKGKITMTIGRSVGEKIQINMKAVGDDVSMVGVKEPAKVGYRLYTLTSSTVVVEGDITFFAANENDITNIDLSLCESLETLQLSSNRIASLDLSHNKKLKTLFCYANQMSTLTLGALPNLTDLRCHTNNIERLELEKLPALKKLWVYQNAISELDVSGNLLLEELFCEENPLETLDLSHNLELKNFYCSKTGRLKSLNIEKNKKLVDFHCYGNKLEEIILPDAPHIKRVACFENKISDENMKKLVEALPSREGKSAGVFIVVSIGGDEEFNVCSRASVKIAKDKNWKVQAYAQNGQYTDYEGNGGDEPTDSSFIRFRTEKPVGSELIFYGKLNGEDISVEGATITLEKPTTLRVKLQKQEVLIKADFFAFAAQNAEITEFEFKQPHLLSLYLDRNKLKEINLRDLPSLIALNVEKNEIEQLDLSELTALEKLMCGSNQIKNLPLRANIKLVELKCENNLIKQLDLFGNTSIGKVVCHNNKISKSRAVTFFRNLPHFGNTNYANSGLIVFTDTKSATEENRAYKIDVSSTIAKGYKVADFSAGQTDQAHNLLLPPYEGVEGGEEGRDWKIYVGGTQIMAANAEDILEDGGSAVYDSESRVLTLTNVNENAVGGAALANSGVDGLTVKVVGENVLRASDNYVGFGVSRTTRFIGPGSLTIESLKSAGVNLNKTQITFDNCDINIIGKVGIAGVNGKSGEKVTVKNSDVAITGEFGAFFMADLVLEGCDFEQKDEVSYSAVDKMVVGKNKKLFQGTFKIKRTEIDSISTIVDDTNDLIVAIYNLQGFRYENLQPGVNILRLKSGKTKKVIVRQ